LHASDEAGRDDLFGLDDHGRLLLRSVRKLLKRDLASIVRVEPGRQALKQLLGPSTNQRQRCLLSVNSDYLRRNPLDLMSIKYTPSNKLGIVYSTKSQKHHVNNP